MAMCIAIKVYYKLTEKVIALTKTFLWYTCKCEINHQQQFINNNSSMSAMENQNGN